MQQSARAHGATGNGQTEDTRAIQQAIDACFAAGGGRVCVEPGLYMIGSLELRSRVELHLERGATLRGIFNGTSYRPISPDERAMTALVFARDAVDVAISGGGTIDGQGPRYWRKLESPRSGRPDVDAVGVRQFWYEHIRDLSKPNRLVAFLRCRHVQVTGVHLTGAVSWTCHLIGSQDVKIRGVDIVNPIHGPNTDGIDVDGSSDVLISDCTIETGDDAIVLKTTNLFGCRTPIRNVTVTNCRLYSGCNAFKIGTETQEDIENVCFSNATIHCPDGVPPVDRTISGIALETVDGGNVRNVACSNITMIKARTALFLRLGERLRGERTAAGTMRGIALSNILATGTTHPSVVSGMPGRRIEDLQIHNLQLECPGGGRRTAAEIGEVSEKVEHYPEVWMFGEVPAAALYLRHAERVTLGACHLRLQEPDARPLCHADDVERLEADGRLFEPPARSDAAMAGRSGR